MNQDLGLEVFYMDQTDEGDRSGKWWIKLKV